MNKVPKPTIALTISTTLSRAAFANIDEASTDESVAFWAIEELAI